MKRVFKAPVLVVESTLSQLTLGLCGLSCFVAD
jgi:hypothetical protein